MKRIIVMGGSAEHSLGKAVARDMHPSYEVHHWWPGREGGLSWRRFIKDIIVDNPDDTFVFVMTIGKMHNSKIGQSTEFDIQDVITANLVTPMIMVNYFVELLMDETDRRRRDKDKHDKIIFVGSMAYRRVFTNMSLYSAAKAGLDMFGRNLSVELASRGVDVYMVHPGTIDDTPMKEQTVKKLQDMRDMTEQQARDYVVSNEPSGSNVTKADVCGLIRYLAGNGTMFLSGSSIDMPGGTR